MNRRHMLKASAALALGGCINSFPVASYTYRLKIAVALGAVEHAGESIIKAEVQDMKGAWGNDNNGLRFKVRTWAEAPVIDLGPTHGLLFALLFGLSYEGPSFSARDSVVNRLRGNRQLRDRTHEIGFVNPDAKWEAIRTLQNHSGEEALWPDQLPILARFGDVNDPASVTEVAPDRMHEIYGDGARFVRATVEMVDAKPTDRIFSILPWLAAQQGGFQETPRNTPFVERTFAQRVSRAHFRTWSDDRS
jgi:hypothetical protein